MADENKNEWRTLAEQLVNDIPQDGGSVIVYNASFEKTRMKEMANAFPDLAERLLDFNARLIDLRDIFRGGYMYMKEMGGSFSIKNVLPAVCPAFSYDSLVGVKNGTQAMTAFLALRTLPKEQCDEIREQLLAYCKLDTLAMVEIYRELCKQVNVFEENQRD